MAKVIKKSPHPLTPSPKGEGELIHLRCMISFPNCKINLGLNIVEKRTDGFHNIESVFYPVQFTDVLEIVEKEGSGAEFTSSGIPVPGGADDNLCVRAYNLLKRNHDLPAIKIHLHKIIPIGAGLGGGSADAAFFIKMLNDKFGLWMPWDEVHDYARKMGSDCSFFISNKPSYVFGRGDEFENIDLDLSNYHLVLVSPNIHIDTAAAYSGIVPKKSSSELTSDIFLPIEDWKSTIKNDFEETIFAKHPEIKKIKEKLYSLGAVYSSMSGSGSSVYGIFETKTDLKREFPNCFVWEAKL